MILKTIAALASLALTAELATATTIVIHEVFYDGAGSDAPAAFTELTGPPGTDLDGWSIVGVNGSTATPYRVISLMGATIPLDGVFLVATVSAAAELAAVRDFIGNVDWQNGPDAVHLRNGAGELVDSLQYGNAGQGNSGEGEPAPDVSAGFSLTRNGSSIDTNDNRSDFREAVPTPGSVGAPVSMPLPSSGALIILGLAMVAVCSTRTRS